MIDYICLIVLHVVFGNSNALTPLQYARSLCQGIIKDSNLFYITFFYVLPFKGELEKKFSIIFLSKFLYIFKQQRKTIESVYFSRLTKTAV